MFSPEIQSWIIGSELGVSFVMTMHQKIQWYYGFLFTKLRPRHIWDILNCIFLNENVLILATISLKFVSKGQINNIPAVIQIKAWYRSGDKPLSELMMVGLLTHRASLDLNDKLCESHSQNTFLWK